MPNIWTTRPLKREEYYDKQPSSLGAYLPEGAIWPGAVGEDLFGNRLFDHGDFPGGKQAYDPARYSYLNWPENIKNLFAPIRYQQGDPNQPEAPDTPSPLPSPRVPESLAPPPVVAQKPKPVPHNYFRVGRGPDAKRATPTVSAKGTAVPLPIQKPKRREPPITEQDWRRMEMESMLGAEIPPGMFYPPNR